jgi:hypothetical protein
MPTMPPILRRGLRVLAACGVAILATAPPAAGKVWLDWQWGEAMTLQRGVPTPPRAGH